MWYSFKLLGCGMIQSAVQQYRDQWENETKAIKKTPWLIGYHKPKSRDNKQLHGRNYYKMTAFRATLRTYNARKQQLKDQQQQHKEETIMQMKPSSLILAVLLLQASFIHGEERTH